MVTHKIMTSSSSIWATCLRLETMQIRIVYLSKSKPQEITRSNYLILLLHLLRLQESNREVRLMSDQFQYRQRFLLIWISLKTSLQLLPHAKEDQHQGLVSILTSWSHSMVTPLRYASKMMMVLEMMICWDRIRTRGVIASAAPTHSNPIIWLVWEPGTKIVLHQEQISKSEMHFFPSLLMTKFGSDLERNQRQVKHASSSIGTILSSAQHS